MKQRSILAAVAMFAMAVLGLTATASAQGNGAESSSVPFDGVYYNPCCNEWIEFSGSLHFTFRSVVNDDGTITTHSTMNLVGMKGTGMSSGIDYHANNHSASTETFTLEGPGPYSFDQTYMDNIVGKGKGGRSCSFKVKQTVHIVVDAEGNLVDYDVDIEFICANGNSIE